MWILILVLLLVGAHLNLTALVPLQPGDPSPRFECLDPGRHGWETVDG